MAKKKFGYGNFYCTVCGERVEKNAANCPKCSAPYGDEKYMGISQTGAGGIGYSNQENDHRFKENKKKNGLAGFIFLIVLTVAVAAFMVLSGQIKTDSDGFKIMLLVIGIIWVFDIIWFISSNIKKSDWEGVVESKKNFIDEHNRTNADGDSTATYRHIYRVYFRTTDGKKKKLQDVDNSKNYDRFCEGDRVRFIGSLRYYEKHDKTADAFIPCASCGSFRDARENYCGKCGCVILKGAPVNNNNAPTGNFKVCPNCGTQLDLNSKFCTECGTKF